MEYTYEQIRRRLIRVVEAMTNKYGDEEITLVGVMDGAIQFLTDLMRLLPMPKIVCTTKISTYEGDRRVRKPRIMVPVPPQYIEGKNVIIVEDIIDSGQTIEAVVDYIQEMSPKTCRIACVFDNAYMSDYNLLGKTDGFVVGYGMDYNGKYRDYSYIKTLERE